MPKAPLLLSTVALLLLLSVERTQAQASCPSTDNLSFLHYITGAAVDTATLATKRARIYIGSVPSGGSFMNVAWIWLDGGACTPYYLSHDGHTIAPQLSENTNLCLGGLNDIVDNLVDTHPPFACAGWTYQAYPMVYNGYRLHIYAGGGDDTVWGSYGVDRVYGGSGHEFIDAVSGTGDRIYGETNSDMLECSRGASTLCDGGGAVDEIEDFTGNGDSIYGGGSSDDISVCGTKTVDCGTGDDDSLRREWNWSATSCENIDNGRLDMCLYENQS